MTRDARTLPWSWYHDPEILARERDEVFRPAWHYVGHTGDVPGPRSCHPTEVAGVPVVVTRDQDDGIHALVNVCRHRGAVVCEQSEARETLQCPYHAWTYDLDGTLRSAPRSDREERFEPADHGLVALPVGTWGPFVFVSVDPLAPPLAEVLADLPGRVAEIGLDVDSLRFLKRTHGEYRANWKICVENFLECYHCRVAHPGFSRVIDTGPDDYLLVTDATFSSQYGPVRERWAGDFDPRGPIPRGQFHLLYPGTTINIMPGFPNVSIGPVLPMSPGTTHRFLDYFVGPDVAEEWIAHMLAFDEQVGVEDLVLVETVQRGVQAAILPDGRLFLDSERLIVHFDDYIRKALG